MKTNQFIQAVVLACAAALPVGVVATQAPLSQAEAAPVLAFGAGVARARFSVSLPNFEGVPAVRLVSVPAVLRGHVEVAAVSLVSGTQRAKITVRLKDRSMFSSALDEPIRGALKFQLTDATGVKKNINAKVNVVPGNADLPTSMTTGVMFLSFQHGPSKRFLIGGGFDPNATYTIVSGAPTVISKIDGAYIPDGEGWSLKVNAEGNLYLKPRADAVLGSSYQSTMYIESDLMNGVMELHYDLRPAF